MKIEDFGLWETFSLYIRLRDSNYDGIGKCISCEKHFYFRYADCGHLVPRTHKATKYDERNNNLQCVRCNRVLNGNLEEYTKRIDYKHGNGTAESLQSLSRKVHKYSEVDYKELEIHYRSEIKKLLQKKSGEVRESCKNFV